MIKKISELFSNQPTGKFMKIEEQAISDLFNSETYGNSEEQERPSSNNHHNHQQSTTHNKINPKTLIIIVLSFLCLYLYGFFDYFHLESSTLKQKQKQSSNSQSSVFQSSESSQITQQAPKVTTDSEKQNQKQINTNKDITSSQLHTNNIATSSHTDQNSLEQPFTINQQQNQPLYISEQIFYLELLEQIKPKRATHLNLKTPQLYLDIFKIPKSKELPFCFVIRNVTSYEDLRETLKSIQEQNYSNYEVAYSGPEDYRVDLTRITYNDVDKLKRKEIYATKKLVDAGCSRTSIVVPIRAKIKPNYLIKLNVLYQRQNIWLTYDYKEGDEFASVSSFYRQILNQITYDLITKYAPESQQLEIQKFAYSLIYLAKYHTEAFPKEWIYDCYPVNGGLSRFKGTISATTKPYISEPMMYFQPNHQTEAQVLNYLKKLNTTTPPQNKYKPRNNLTLPMMLKALEYYSLKDFPKNHTLFQRELLEYEEKYHFSQYKSQIPICAIVLTKDNIEQNRYKKVLQSIKIQNYSNYHIVFVDDASEDDTYDESVKYVKEIRLSGRTDFIKNQKQMFATYNIQNVVHNYCRAKQVAILIDGDDQLIGRQVFKLVNYAYSSKQSWLVYFSFFSTIYMYAVSQEPRPQFFEYDQPRHEMKVIGALRTFYVDLYRKIQMKDHKDDQGEFFDRLYDDAMQHPLLEMSGLQHTRYIPQIVYFYNQDYSRNDGATKEGRQDWIKHEKEVVSRPKYKPLAKLFSQR